MFKSVCELCAHSDLCNMFHWCCIVQIAQKSGNLIFAKTPIQDFWKNTSVQFELYPLIGTGKVNCVNAKYIYFVLGSGNVYEKNK